MPEETQETSQQPAPESGTPPPSAPPATAPVQMTREELNRQIEQARNEGAKSARESQEVKELKAKARRLDEIEESSKTELQKAIDRAAQAEAKAGALEGKYRSALVRGSFIGLAVERGLKGQPLEDAIALADLSAVEVAEDGTVKGADTALNKVLEGRPYLLAGGDASPSGSGQGTGNGRPAPQIGAPGRSQTVSREQQIEQAQREMRERGMSVRIT